MRISNLLIAAVVVVALGGCKNEQKGNNVEMPGDTMEMVSADADEQDVDAVEEVEVQPAAPAESYFDRKARSGNTQTDPAQKPAPTTAKTNAKAETIYVETDGAQGRVWGHVTMKGDRGTGTIHDWDENTLTVSVTRHGDELFAVDQNSRQYVFKLKK